MYKKSILISLATVLLLGLMVNHAGAIPAFARKYKVSCSTCHIAIPKLKVYGDEVAANGFHLPDGEEPKRAYIDTGDDLLMLNSDFPIAVRFDAFAQVADRENAKTDFGVPFGIKLLSGGTVSRKVSYYFYFYLSEAGDVAGVEDAYLYFNNIGGVPFNLTVGQFQVCDPLFKRELRLTYEDYEIFRVSPGLSQANLTYDRGLILDYGFDFGLTATGMVLNGNGIKPAENDIFDSDNNKSFVLRLKQEIGPVGIGVFGYTGKETLSDSASVKNKILDIGPDLTIVTENWELALEYLHREDDNARFLTSNPVKTKTDGGFAELTVLPESDRSRFIYTLLYNYVNSNMDELDYQTGTLSISYMAARNLRMLAEGTYDMKNKKSRFTLGIVSAF